MGYQEALDMATRLGYAEADPTADVEGYDAGRKIAIMASIAFSSRVTFPQVYTEGITKITAEDIRYAKEFGYVIKLLGITKLTGKGIEVKVHPTLIPDSHPLATVRDSFNAVFVHGQACDDAMFMGRGAGQMPTASAVLGDVIDVMRNIIHGSCGKIGSDSHKKLLVLDVEETKSRFILRLPHLAIFLDCGQGDEQSEVSMETYPGHYSTKHVDCGADSPPAAPDCGAAIG